MAKDGRSRTRLWVTSSLLFTCACSEPCAPAPVAQGVSRRSVQTAGAVAQLVSSDKTCGFESPRVKSNPTVQGVSGSEGTVTYYVRDCEIDLSSSPLLFKDCNDA